MEDGTSRDWASLPPELLHLISKKLPGLPEFVRFRAVCNDWRSAAPVDDPHPQLPWVLEYGRAVEGHLRFYSLDAEEIYKVHVQEPRKKRLLGPGNRHLLQLFDSWPSFFSKVNPITQKDVRLASPPVPGPGAFGQNMIQSGDYVMLLGGGNLDWIRVQNAYFSPTYYYAGKLFVQRGPGPTDVIDATTGYLLYSIDSPIGPWRVPRYSEEHLVESAGELLRVHQSYTAFSSGVSFEIFRLQFGSTKLNNNARWVKIGTINDQMLFLSEYRGLSLSANNFCGFKGNSIYYFGRGALIFELRRYDIETRTTEVLPCPLKWGSTWLVPSLVKPSLPN